MYSHNKPLYLIIVLAALSIATLDANMELSNISTFQIPSFPLLNYAFAQENTGEDAEDESTQGEAEPTPTTNPSTFTISRTIEGNASMLYAKLPLMKKIIVSDITDIVALSPPNANATLRATAEINDEINNTTQSVSRINTIKSLVSSELQEAVSTLVAGGGNGNLRVLIDNQAQCTAGNTTPDADTTVAANGPSCQFTIRIHQ